MIGAASLRGTVATVRPARDATRKFGRFPNDQRHRGPSVVVLLLARHRVQMPRQTPQYPLGHLPSRVRPSRSGALNDRTRTFLEAYGRWCRKELTQVQAATLAQMSERTFRRNVRRYRDDGADGLHDRRSKPSPRRVSRKEASALDELYVHKYRSFSVRHFFREYRDEHGGTRSYTWVKNRLQQAGLVKRKRRNNPPQDSVGQELTEGVLLHQCVCKFAWSAPATWDLVVTVDDATCRVYSGFFVPEDTIWSRYQSIREILSTKGRFDAVTCDWLDWLGNRCMFTQLVRAIGELGITFIRVCVRHRRSSVATIFSRH